MKTRTAPVWLRTIRKGLTLLAVISLFAIPLAAVPRHASADASCDFARPDVLFDCVGNGRGFAITNDGTRRLLDVYEEFGGEAKLGRVASWPFQDPRIPGFWLQATQHFILQIKDAPDADPHRDGYLLNTLAYPSSPDSALWDTILQTDDGIPKALAWPNDRGLDANAMAELHMQTVFGTGMVKPAMRRIADALSGFLSGEGNYTLLGLPISSIERSIVNGVPRFCVRLQRSGLCWRTDLGAVVPVYAGARLSQTLGLFRPQPANAFVPAPPPSTVTVALQTLAKPVSLFEPLPGPLRLLCGVVPGVPACTPTTLVPTAQLSVDSLTGQGRPIRTDGLALTVSERDLDTGQLLVQDRPVRLTGSAAVPLPALAPHGNAQYDIDLRLTGTYLGTPIPPYETDGAVWIAWYPYARLIGLPAIVVRAALAALAGIVLLISFFRIKRAVRVRRARPLPAYTIVAGGTPRNLASFHDQVVPGSRWIAGTPYLWGSAFGAPGLRFGADTSGTPLVAGAGTFDGKPLGRFRGTPIAAGAIVLANGQGQVLIGPASRLSGMRAPAAFGNPAAGPAFKTSAGTARPRPSEPAGGTSPSRGMPPRPVPPRRSGHRSTRGGRYF